MSRPRPQSVMPEPGRWLWTSREGFETLLAKELGRGARVLAPALVEGDAFKGEPPVFARMGFRVAAVVKSVAEAHAALPPDPMLVQAWVPDAAQANRLSAEATQWGEQLAALRTNSPTTPWAARESGALLGQLCLVAPGVAAIGWVPAREAVSLAAGGRTRMRRSGEAPSRAAMKLDEALDWYGTSPGRGELCADLGSAPGGWTRRLIERGARVLSVDPGQLAPDLRNHKKVRHFVASAFDFEPPESVDWLFCDMAWRPLEVAQLLGKWGRRGWAIQLVANIKLPMNDKLPVIARVKTTLEQGGWKYVKMKQLYHDRDELTVTARMG